MDSEIAAVVLLLGLLALAAHQKDVIYYVVAGLVTCYIAIGWIADYPYIVVPIFALGVYMFFKAVLTSVGSTQSKGWSAFKGLLNRFKGVF